MRHELKYLLSPVEYTIMSSRIRAALPTDPYMVSPDGYVVSSLYFDDNVSSALNDKLAGSDRRIKYRLRLYNRDTSFIRLERKTKQRGMIDKVSHRLPDELALRILAGDMTAAAEDDNRLCGELNSLKLTPAATVIYLREAYMHPLSDTRITFDRRLSAGFSPAAMTLPYPTDQLAVFSDDQVIMEIKYNEYLPAAVRSLVGSALTSSAASKYVLCRQTVMQSGRAFAKQTERK